MLHSMIHWVVAQQFEDIVGKAQSGKEYPHHLGLHVGVEVMSTEDYDKGNQYHSKHLFIYAPMNYVYVMCQERWVDAAGEVHTKPMDVLCYHDSCWRDALSTFFWEHRDVASGWRSFEILGNFDVVQISDEQREFCRSLENFRRDNHKEYNKGERPEVENPFHVGEEMYEYWRDKVKKVTYTLG